MRILIDLQACQSTGSRTRGIGRYSFSLAQAMLKNSASHDMHLLLNAAFPESILDLRHRFQDLVPRQNIHVWHGVMPVAELDNNNRWRLRASELIREQAIRALAPDMVHVSSLFEGLVDDAVTSIAGKEASLSAVTLYDLIPLINAKPYLENPQVRAWYFRKIQSLKCADLLLAISESSRQEGLAHLHFPEEKIVNISSAIDDRFAVQTLSSMELHKLRETYGLSRPFVMYTGGIDLRKNIEGLIEAYAHLPVTLRKEYQLAIVCSVQEHDRERLLRLASSVGLARDDVVMTGFVPDEDLPKLYNACSLFVFPSWHEGFGLPALEAMACGAAVIAANTSSLPEVVGRDDALFDPRNRDAITQKIVEVLTNPGFKQSLIEHGLVQAKKFSWDASAKTAMSAFERAHQERNGKQQFAPTPMERSIKPKLAFFSPLPPSQSGIADYSAELLPELARHYEIEIIAEQNETSDPCLAANFAIRDMDWFEQHAASFSRILYHFGNSMFHHYMLDAMSKFPGVVVLHDFYHSGLIAHLDLTGTKAGIWDHALYQSHGYAALYEKKKTQDLNQMIWKYPCNQLVLENAKGVIVHSEYSKKLAQQWYGADAVWNWKLIQFLRVLPEKIDRERARASLGLTGKDFLICSFGILGPTKLNHTLLNAWLNSSLAASGTCHLVFVGKNDGGEYGATLVETIKKSCANQRVKITGFADLDLFRTYLQAADAAVQLRALSRGETSGAVVDCLAYGIPTIINSNGAMAELPDDVVIKLDEAVEESQLTEKIELLHSREGLRMRLSELARGRVKQVHSPYQIGDEYSHTIESFYASSAMRMPQTVNQIAAIDSPFSDGDLQSAASSLATIPSVAQRKRLLVYCNDLEKMLSRDQLQSLMSALLGQQPSAWRVDPVYFDGKDLRLAAKQFESYLGICSDSASHLDADIIDIHSSDVLLYCECESKRQEVSNALQMRLNVLGVPTVKMTVAEDITSDPVKLATSIDHAWRTIGA